MKIKILKKLKKESFFIQIVLSWVIKSDNLFRMRNKFLRITVPFFTAESKINQDKKFRDKFYTIGIILDILGANE